MVNLPRLLFLTSLVYVVALSQCSACVRLNFDLNEDSTLLRWKGEAIYDYGRYGGGDNNIFVDDFGLGIRIWTEGNVNDYVRTRSSRSLSTYILDLNGGTFSIISLENELPYDFTSSNITLSWDEDFSFLPDYLDARRLANTDGYATFTLGGQTHSSIPITSLRVARVYNPLDEDSYSSSNTADIVGGVVGVMSFLICCVLPCVVIFLLARKRRPQNNSTPMTHVVNVPAPATQPPMSPPVMQPPPTYSPYDQRNSFQHFNPPPQNPYYSNVNQQGTYYTNMNQNPAYTHQNSPYAQQNPHYAQQSSPVVPQYPSDTQKQSSNPPQSPPDPQKAPQTEPNDLEQFLEEAGLSKYFPIFQREEIDLKTLRDLPESQLEKMGIPLGARFKIMNLRRKGNTAKYTKSYIDNIEIGKRLGSGAFGDVYEGLWLSTHTRVALKQLRDTEQLEEFTAEADLLTALRHPQIVSFFGLYSSPNHEEFLVMELMPLGNLREFLIRERKVTSDELLLMISQTASGMSFLEENGVVHRDLAARNLLVKEEDNRYIVKITDFGMSRETHEAYYQSSNKKIPIKWTAPEALRYGKFSSSSDVWSFGVTCWEILQRGEEPYPGMSNNEAVEGILQGMRLSKPEECSDTLYAMMMNCWKEDASARPTFKELSSQLRQETTHISSPPTTNAHEGTLPGNQYDRTSLPDDRYDTTPSRVTSDTMYGNKID